MLEYTWENISYSYSQHMEKISQNITFPWEIILQWYKKNGRHHLPWREYEINKNNKETLLYKIWIAEILLQQTQAERVIPYLSKILERYPNIESLAETDYETFFPYYQWMGYYSRARNILKTAKIVHEKYNGIFPSHDILLRELPWVWKYTSSAIRWFGYGEPILTWDTNLEKVFSRYVHGRKDIWLSKEEKLSLESDFENYAQNIWNTEKLLDGIRNFI